jgi:Helix-turn-helix domain of resolvase
MDQVHVIRHKVLVEGQSARRVAREMGVSRNTVKRYLARAAPTRVERVAPGSAGLGEGRRPVVGAAVRVAAMDRRQATADGRSAARDVAGRGLDHRPDDGQGGGGRVEAQAACSRESAEP